MFSSCRRADGNWREVAQQVKEKRQLERHVDAHVEKGPRQPEEPEARLSNRSASLSTRRGTGQEPRPQG